MRWHAKREGWRRWFAWYPVRIKDEWVWLELVERAHFGGGGDSWHEYRNPPNLRM